MEVGFVLDNQLRPGQTLSLSHRSLNRHTFVCGATGSGKSQTVRTLLQGLSLSGIPWMVIEPAKAEYAGMVGRLGPSGDVLVIRPGDPTKIPGSLNPLEPSPGFTLQTHVDFVRALFLAAFEAEEPFPQIFSAALTRVYERIGWDLTTGEPSPTWASDGLAPRYPLLSELRQAAREVVANIGYSDKITADVLGFVDVRIGGLTAGSPGRFFQGGHPMDVAALLKRNVVFELEGVASDTDKAFLIGAVVIRVFEELQHQYTITPRSDRGQLHHVTVVEEAHRLLRRTEDASGTSAHAVELFVSLLAEIRAYGEGIVVAEQIPAKIIPDVVKNSAIKIVHRLPAADDREFVGAAMNLSEDQSNYVVTLPDGVAAVFADGMDRPVLVALPDNEAKEGGTPSFVPPLVQSRSAGCPKECLAEGACSVAQMRAAEILCEDEPWLALYTELAAIAHVARLLPIPAPHGPSMRRVHARANGDVRLLSCAAARLADTSVARRYSSIVHDYPPQGLSRHLAELVRHHLMNHPDPCLDCGTSFVAGEELRKELERRWKMLDGSSAKRPSGGWEERDVKLFSSGGTKSESDGGSTRAHPFSVDDQLDLLYGTPRAEDGFGFLHQLLRTLNGGASPTPEVARAMGDLMNAPWLEELIPARSAGS